MKCFWTIFCIIVCSILILQIENWDGCKAMYLEYQFYKIQTIAHF